MVRMGDLRKAYREAVENDKEEFIFHGRVFLTNFAHYLLEFYGEVPDDQEIGLEEQR